MKLFIQASAEDDILRQFEYYLEQDRPDIAERFMHSVKTSTEALLARPHAGPPRVTANPKLAALRMWPVRDFDDFRIYYISRDDLIQILRVLHSRRDIRSIIGQQDVDEPSR